jgi:hypothetical protein
VAAALLRLPAALRPGQIGFDDGVYGWSAVTMRSGALPYIDIFCGQGPLFLPLLRVADVIGGQATWSPRLLGVVAAAVLVAATGLIAATGGDRRAAFVAMGLVATSGLVFRTTTAIEAEPTAMVFAGLTVLVAVRQGPVWLVGVLAGAALSVKSLLVVPAVLAALVVLVNHRGRRDALGAGAIAAGVVLVAALPWGLAAVWEQSVAFHLDAREGFPVWANVRVVARAAWDFDRLLLAAGAIAVATVVAGVATTRASGASPTTTPARSVPARGTVVLANGIWLVGTAAVAAIHSPLFAHHATALIVPAAVLVALARPWLPALVAAAALVLPGQASRVDWRATPEVSPGQESAIADLERLVPDGTTLITDGPGLGWWAGAATPPWLVDISHVRLDAGYLTAAEIEEAAAAPDNCAVLVWSPRLSGIKPLPLLGYSVEARYGEGQTLWIRDSCGG